MQTKQVSFLDVNGVPATHGYEYRNAWLGTAEEPESAQTIYRFSTSGQEGLGDQLPAGTLRFYLRDKRGDPQFIGESAISHTPMGSDLSLATGDAFDRSEEHTSELQSLMRISYAVFCLKKKNNIKKLQSNKKKYNTN